jgi:hypothetical protein
MSTKKTAADIIRDPVAAKRTHKQRVDYLNMPEVQRSLAIEKAEKKAPLHDESPAKRKARERFNQMRNQKGKVN